jgi:hypothetical protein
MHRRYRPAVQVVRRSETEARMSALGQKADIGAHLVNVRFTLKQTLELNSEMSALCHKRTHALQQKCARVMQKVWQA